MFHLWLARLAAAQPAPLDADALVADVVVSNPTVAAAEAALRAADASIGASRARPDPMLEAMLAPATLAHPHVDPGLTVTLSQPLPPPGAVSRAVAVARARERAVRAELDVLRQDLALQAITLLAALWRTDRALAINTAHEALVRELADSARARYAAGGGSLQDPLQADLAAVELQEERITLAAERAALAARVNALRHAPPDTPLAPAEPADPEPPAPDRRPERAVAEAEVAAAAASAALTRARNAPSLALMGQYSSMWAMPAHRWMVGASVDLPLQRSARAAGVDQADADLARARADQDTVDTTLTLELHIARIEVDEADQRLALARDRRLPLARERLAAARQAYAAATGDLSLLIDAARALADAELDFASATAALHTRRAALARAQEAP